MSKPMNRRKFVRQIETNGWSLDRTVGGHDVYKKSGSSLAVPRHTEVSAGVVREYEQKNKKEDGK